MSMILFPEFLVGMLRMLMGFFIIFTGALKFLDLKGFTLIAMSYKIVPKNLKSFTRILAYLIPYSELFGGFFLLIWRFPSNLVAISFLIFNFIIYSIALSYDLFKGEKKENCGCYGTALEAPVSWKEVYRNIFLLLVSVYLLLSILMN